MVWEELARASSSLSLRQLMEACGLEMARVTSAVSRLKQSRLVEVASPLPDVSYLPALRLDAMRWAQALELGVPLTVLERHAKLATGTRAEALRVATDGTLEREAARQIAERRESARRLVEGRAATRAAASDLARIEEDANHALESAQLDPAAAAVLRHVRDQASAAVEDLRRRLVEGRR